MKKKVVLYSILMVLLANVSNAQEPDAEGTSISFFQIVQSSGTLGQIIWMIIFTMLPVGIILGIISTVSASIRKTDKMPLSFKWLVIAPFFYFFVGASAVILGIFNATSALETVSGAKKATALAISISNTLYAGVLTVMGILPFLFFIVLSLVIIHLKKRNHLQQQVEVNSE